MATEADFNWSEALINSESPTTMAPKIMTKMERINETAKPETANPFRTRSSFVSGGCCCDADNKFMVDVVVVPIEDEKEEFFSRVHKYNA